MTSLVPRNRSIGIFDVPSRLMSREMDQLFRTFFDDFDRSPQFAAALVAPAFDLTETPETFVVKAEVPGMDAKDIDIEIEGDLLKFSGEKKEETTRDKDNVHFTERRFGKWSRAFRLPTVVDSSRVEAKINNGVLEVTLGKKTEAKPQIVKVKPA